MSTADLLVVLNGLPDEATLPVAYLRQIVAGDGGPATSRVPAIDVDHRVEAVAAALELAPSTVRGMCSDGRLEGAYRREGREWRIPPSAVRAYQDTEQARHRAPRTPYAVRPTETAAFVAEDRRRGAPIVIHPLQDEAEIDKAEISVTGSAFGDRATRLRRPTLVRPEDFGTSPPCNDLPLGPGRPRLRTESDREWG